MLSPAKKLLLVLSVIQNGECIRSRKNALRLQLQARIGGVAL